MRRGLVGASLGMRSRGYGSSNSAPVITVPGSQSMNGNITGTYPKTAYGFDGAISVADADDDNQEVTVAVSNGKLTCIGITGASIVAGEAGVSNHEIHFMFPAANDGHCHLEIDNGVDVDYSIQIFATDRSTELRAALAAELPANWGPGETFAESTMTEIDGVVHVYIAFDSTNATPPDEFGTYTITQDFTAHGVTYTTGDGSDDATIVMTGTLAQVNSALESLIYVPNDDYLGSESLTVDSDDGTDEADQKTVTITVVSIPESLTSATLRGWYDGDDLTTLFTDTAGSTPATALDDVIARWNNKINSGAPYFSHGTSGNRPLLKAVSGGVGRGLKFDGSDDYLDVSDSSYYQFMHKTAGFTLLIVGAFTSADSGTIQAIIDSTDQDNAKVGVGLYIREDGANVGHSYGWVGPVPSGQVMSYIPDSTDNSHDTNMLKMLWAWENGVSGDDGIFRFDGAATYSRESEGTPSSSSSASALRLGASSGAMTGRYLGMTVRHVLIYEGRLSADEIALLEAWADAQ